MKAIIRWGLSLFSLLLLSSISHGYVWVSPVTKCPLGVAPSLMNMCPMYVMGWDGKVYGPYWYLRPPFSPYQGHLPGPIGQALQSGTLSYQMLQDQKAMEKTLQGMPMLGQKKNHDDAAKQAPNLPQAMGEPPPQFGPPPGWTPYGNPAYGGSPYGAPQPGGSVYSQAYRSGVPSPYPLAMNPGGGMQMPYMAPPPPSMMPAQPQPMQTPYLGQGAVMPAPMPYPAPRPYPPMPYPMPQPMMPMMPPGSYAPMPMMPPAAALQPGMPAGIWLVQSVAPVPPPLRMPVTFDGMPAMPPTPGMRMGPAPFPWYGPMPGAYPYLPQPPRMGPVPMDLPRMEMGAPPPARVPAGYPTHPFVRGPRDFFMWGDVMSEEKARGSRPALVP